MTTYPSAARYGRPDGRIGYRPPSEPPTAPTRADPIASRVAPGAIEREQPAAAVERDQAHRADPALIRACVDGDERAWETLVER